MEELDLKRLKEIEIEDTRTKIISELKKLEQDEKIKRYLQLKEDNERLFSEQKELVGMIPAVNLESPTFVTQDEEDTMSLVYSMQNK